MSRRPGIAIIAPGGGTGTIAARVITGTVTGIGTGIATIADRVSAFTSASDPYG
ncbi:MAG TPA: hypothetical protein VNR51_05835 [Hyphomicrobium sp.]|nr:hypothetical protein [Hyphomicrobium sp.]